PTDTYTLSLHDALPILGAHHTFARGLGGALGGRRLAPLSENPVRSLEVSPRLDQGRLAVHHRSPAPLTELLDHRRADLHHTSWLDRKSTRLNSSHDQIS